MDFQDSPEEAGYRTRARAWLDAHAPAHELPRGATLDDAEQVARGRRWQAELARGGYAGILLPPEMGGSGGTTAQAAVFTEEEGRFRLPKGHYIGIGLGMALPALHAYGTPAQIERFAAATLSGGLTWCQLFSEPGAGSDLAALRTRAVRDGDDWVVNGQKVWSSWAHMADWGILLVRTNPDVPKHKGLSFFLVDMKADGILVRPIRQMSGASDFNETFFTDVRIPDSCRVGALGEGWAVAMTVLMGERLNQGAEGQESGMAEMIRLAAQTRRDTGTALDSAAVRLQLAQAYAEEQAERHFQARLRTMVSRGESPGALAALVKLAFSGRAQKMSGLALELQEMTGLAYAPNDASAAALAYDYIWSAALRVAGGADEVLRNQLSERVLGMPGDVRSDKHLPFNQL